MAMKHTVFITGAAGYVGAMLVERIAAREDVERVIGLDKEPGPEALKGIGKLVYIQANTADSWEEQVARYQPDIVIHTAWQIREIYGDHALTWKWNIDGSDRVFDFAFSNAFVKRLVHFSTVASYGAFADNTTEHRYTEDEPFRKTDYLYAEEKRITEEHLKERYEKRANKDISVAIIRPAAITGPRGRFMRIRFGLQSALSGTLKQEKSFAYNLVSAMTAWVPITPKWLRQYVHEDDIAGIVDRLAFGEPVKGYEAFNAAPPGAAVYGPDMAKAVGKRALPIQPWMVRLPFFFFWHLTRGKIPTGKGSWKGYSYPIAVDGSKITRTLGYPYRYGSFDAFYYTDGAYESYVPENLRRSKASKL
jgi:nucleoside-diphosphate-sugar epimerase